jgi:hypothetical protein
MLSNWAAEGVMEQEMSIPGMMSSRHQRRLLFLGSTTLLVACCLGVFLLYHLAPDARWSNTLIGFLLSVISSATFALFAVFYMYYFFTDPLEIDAATKLVAQDIWSTLEATAEEATNYKIYVRTGRHFRAEVLPILARTAQRKRHPVSIEAVLLDLRDTNVCQRYAAYRSSASFDRKVWSIDYVQREVLATILALSNAVSRSGGLLSVDLYLTKRLSTFRIEGGEDQLIVTREDPKDIALRYRREQDGFSAFLHEFDWVKQESLKISLSGESAQAIGHALSAQPLVSCLWAAAEGAQEEGSPYAR